MEKENAEKANTESENSVASEEQSSLAENEEKSIENQAENEPDNLPNTEGGLPIAESGGETDASPNKAIEEVAEKVETERQAATKEDQDKITDVEEPEAVKEEDNVETASTQENLAVEKTPETIVRDETTVAETEVEPSPDGDEITQKTDIVSTQQDTVEAVNQPESDENKELNEDDLKKDEKDSTGNKEETGDQNIEEEPNEFKDVDFTTYSKEELVEVIKTLGKDENPFKADKILQEIAPLFNKMRAEDREKALKKFIADGGVEDDFQYKTDELSLRFDANYKLIKDKKSKKFKEQGHERVKNQAIAEEVLEELRKFMDSEESTASFNQFKKIQEKWKAIGDVPSQNSKTLWANYNALIHRFYDQRSIYFELKELDRKKNYEAKLVLCEKAEALENEGNLRVAIKNLNDLHYEYKHLGPVPQELQEELWQRFKAASDKVYEKRKEFVSELKASLQENLTKKQELVEKIKVLTDFQSDRIKEWNEKTKEVIQLQKTWDSIGGLPKEKAKQINREFWSSFKKFFSHKHEFFKKLDAERDNNLIKKQELLEKAEALKDNEDWEETANKYKKLQSEWREIGPVPEKMRNKIYLKFKAACDHFFDQRRAGHKTSQESYKENLAKKKEIIDKINSLKEDADNHLDDFNAARKQFLEIGFVPKKNISSIKESFQKSVESFLAAVSTLNDKQKTEISLEAEFSGLAGAEHSEQDLYQKEQAVRRHINKLEDDIALWRNNLEFFANSKSKSTDKLRKDVNAKIESAVTQLEGLKRQLKMVRSL